MTSDFTVHMDEYLPLREVVFNTLRQAILKGELKPGERLMEIALAEKLGVSRTPIREAMRKLELEGLVVMIPRRGAQANAALATLPAWVTTIFGKSPVVLATIIAVCLNLILPKSRDEEKEEKIYDSQVQEKLEEDHKMFENDQK